jgi:hypothetical protein
MEEEGGEGEGGKEGGREGRRKRKATGRANCIFHIERGEGERREKDGPGGRGEGRRS